MGDPEQQDDWETPTEAQRFEAGHEHADCPPNERRWLERRPDEAATMELHVHCVVCGQVKHTEGPRARPRGYYLSGLSALKEYLEGNTTYAKMSQAQGRLIVKALEGIDGFGDAYGLSLDVQKRLYVEAVRAIRPDLDEELVERLLPKPRRRTRRPLFAPQGGASPG